VATLALSVRHPLVDGHLPTVRESEEESLMEPGEKEKVQHSIRGVRRDMSRLMSLVNSPDQELLSYRTTQLVNSARAFLTSIERHIPKQGVNHA
jgi:hypothetical protein